MAPFRVPGYTRAFFGRPFGQGAFSMTPLRQRFVEDMQRRNLAARTIETYTSVVAAFARHFRLSPEHLDAEHVRQYQLHLIAQSASWSRFNIAVAALRFLYRVTLRRTGVVEMIPYAKKPRVLPPVLGQAEVARLIASAVDDRFAALLQTTYGCGLRISEVTRLRISDIDAERRVLHIHGGKGGKDRLMPLSNVLLERLRDYWRKHRPDDWLFAGQKPGCPLSIGQVQRLFRLTLAASGIAKKARMHTLRHSYATHLLEAGVDLPTLQRLLGHNQLSTTLLYIHLRQADLNRTISPLDTLPALSALEDPSWNEPPWTSEPSSDAAAKRPEEPPR
jgi:integrase/recombinase XerD